MSTLTQRLPRTLAVLHQSHQTSYRLLHSSIPLVRHASSAAAPKPRPHNPPSKSSNTRKVPSKPPPKLAPQRDHNAQTQSRPAPSPTPPAASPKSSRTINPPITTLPAPLEIPARDPQKIYALHLFAIGKTYVAFYKTGTKNIWHNYKAARPIHSRILSEHAKSLPAAVAAGAITRSDFQLLARNKHDVKRVPAFALVLLICGEFTPIVVLAFSNVVPWTCRIPKQIDGDRKILEERRAISFRNLTMPPPEKAGTEGLGRMQLLHICWSLGLSSRAWDWFGGRLPGLPTFMLRRKVSERVDYLGMDDKLIEKAGGLRDMSLEELRMACVERGINVLERTEEALKRDLESWLQSREKVSYERLLLTRPNMWPASR